MAEGWKTIRVFISSTFRDMQAERDHLVRFVFPRLREELLKRRIHISKRGSHSTVVWNPWEKKAAGFADLGAAPATRGGWRQFVCVESANARDNTLTLAPGQSHCLAVRYHTEPI